MFPENISASIEKSFNISENGKKAINDNILEYFSKQGLDTCSFVLFGDMWTDVGSNIHSDGRGKIAKRISNFFFKKSKNPLYFGETKKHRDLYLQISRDNNFISALGVLANIHVIQVSGNFEVLRQDNPTNWNEGDFGDSGSCFYQSYRGHMEAIAKEDDYFGLEFYKDGESFGLHDALPIVQ